MTRKRLRAIKRKRWTDNTETTLGPCCNCERLDGVTNVVMLARLGPVPGQGWGCVVCHLPCDGAVAVLCHLCVNVSPPRLVCSGYPAEGRRVLFSELSPEIFDHDPAQHEGDDD